MNRSCWISSAHCLNFYSFAFKKNGFKLLNIYFENKSLFFVKPFENLVSTAARTKVHPVISRTPAKALSVFHRQIASNVFTPCATLDIILAVVILVAMLVLLVLPNHQLLLPNLAIVVRRNGVSFLLGHGIGLNGSETYICRCLGSITQLKSFWPACTVWGGLCHCYFDWCISIAVLMYAGCRVPRGPPRALLRRLVLSPWCAQRRIAAIPSLGHISRIPDSKVGDTEKLVLNKDYKLRGGRVFDNHGSDRVNGRAQATGNEHRDRISLGCKSRSKRWYQQYH